MSTFNDTIIDEFRRNGGRVDSAGFGTHLVLIHTTGAQTGQPRLNPAMSIRGRPDDAGAAGRTDSWMVIASAMGAPRDPAWAVNLRAHPDTHIEVAGENGVETVPVTAVELHGTEYEQAFARFVRRSSAFTTYQERANERRLPVIRLTRRDSDPPATATPQTTVKER